VATTNPEDLVAGTITALVSIISPAISGGSIVGTSFSALLAGILVQINAYADPYLGANAGIGVSRGGIARVIIYPEGIWLVNSAGGINIQLRNDGTIFIAGNLSTGQSVIAYGVNASGFVSSPQYSASGHVGVTETLAASIAAGRHVVAGLIVP
jgi:hypothetical protein